MLEAEEEDEGDSDGWELVCIAAELENHGRRTGFEA